MESSLTLHGSKGQNVQKNPNSPHMAAISPERAIGILASCYARKELEGYSPLFWSSNTIVMMMLANRSEDFLRGGSRRQEPAKKHQVNRGSLEYDA